MTHGGAIRWAGWLGVAALGSAVGTIACGSLGGFACASDEQCIRDDQAGVCVDVGYCAYPDDLCDSGLRFSPDAAEPWAGTCTEVDPPSGSSTSGDPDPGSTSSGEGSESSSTAAEPVPLCGDGVVDPDEECDDANEQRGDGCNPDCRASGVLVGSFTSGYADSDVAYDLVLTGDGDVVLAGAEQWPDESWNIAVIRYSPEGEERWPFRRQGSAGLGDYGRALALTDAGTVLAVGYVVPSAARGVTPRAQIWLTELDLADGTARWDRVEGTGPPSNDQAWDVVALPGGELAVAGRIGPNSNADLLVRRYAVGRRRGEPVVSTVWSYVVDGPATATDWGYAALRDAYGRIVAAGYTRATSGDIDRWLEALAPDDGVSERPPCRDDGSTADGRVEEGNDQIRGLALAPDGSIAAVGFAEKTQADGVDAWIGYYEPDGCALTWNRTVSGAAHGRDEATAVAIDPDDGTIAVVGFLREHNSDDVWVAKWDASGEPRWEAELYNGPGDGTDRATAVAIAPDHEIVVAGYVAKPGQSDAWVGRYTP